MLPVYVSILYQEIATDCRYGSEMASDKRCHQNPVLPKWRQKCICHEYGPRGRQERGGNGGGSDGVSNNVTKLGCGVI